jgi:hypothetical protein
MDDIHANPVRRGLCQRSRDGRWSSTQHHEHDAVDPTTPQPPRTDGRSADFFLQQANTWVTVLSSATRRKGTSQADKGLSLGAFTCGALPILERNHRGRDDGQHGNQQGSCGEQQPGEILPTNHRIVALASA